MCYQNIDFWGKVIPIITPILTALITLGLFFFGYNKYRKEIDYKERRELSVNIMSLFYQVQDLFKYLRQLDNLITSEAESKMKEAELLGKKFYENVKPLNDLFSLKYKFLSIFVNEDGKIFDELWKLKNEYLGALSLNVFIQDEGRGSAYQKNRSTYLNLTTEADEFELKVKSIVDKYNLIHKDILLKNKIS